MSSRFWSLVADAWQPVDGGAICSALSSGPLDEDVARALPEKLSAFIDTLGRQLITLPRVARRGWLREYMRRTDWIYRSETINALDMRTRDDTRDSVSLVPLFGEALYEAVYKTPALAARLRPLRTLLADRAGTHEVLKAIQPAWRQELAAEIRAAFDEVPYPGDEAVHTIDWSTKEEMEFFAGRDWRSVRPDELEYRHCDLSFFKPSGLHYLYPAFMLASFEPVFGESIRTALLYNVSHFESLPPFSPAQRRAIAEVVLYHFEWDHSYAVDLVAALTTLFT